MAADRQDECRSLTHAAEVPFTLDELEARTQHLSHAAMGAFVRLAMIQARLGFAARLASAGDHRQAVEKIIGPMDDATWEEVGVSLVWFRLVTQPENSVAFLRNFMGASDGEA